jgi:hypothetical protein
MSEPTTPPSTTTEKTVVVSSCHLRSLWTLTLISLTLNLVILALLVVGAIIHHHMVREMAQGNGPRGGPAYAQVQGGFGHRFGGMGHGGGWGRHGGGNRGDGGRRDPGQWGGGHGGNGPGFGGGQGMRGGGMGGGMMGGRRNGPPDPALMTDRMLNRLSNQLSLTDDQKAKLKPILDAQAAEMQKDMQTQHDAMQKSMDDTKAKIKALLTPDQQKQFDAMPMPGGPRPPGPPQTGQ